MKYFTKEWYMLNCNLDVDLVEDSRAAYYSEEYFIKLYKEKLREFLIFQKELYSVTYEEMCPPFDHNFLASQGLDDKEIEKLKNEYLEQREKIKEYLASREPYNEEKETENCQEGFSYNLNRIQEALPEYIKKEVADIRIFALNRATKEVIDKTKRYCTINREKYFKAIDDYQKYYEAASKTFDNEIDESMQFHDCRVIDIKQNKEQFIITLDNKGGFTDIDQIIFSGYKLIKQDSSLFDAWWLYEEIYKVDNGYEIHVLLESSDQKPAELIIYAETISFHHNED